MRVTIAANTYQAADGRTPRHGLTVGAAYDVFEVSVLSDRGPAERAIFTVIDDDGFPDWVPVVLVDAGPGGRDLLFDLPPGWVFEVHPWGNGCTLSEAEISRRVYRGPCSFWEDFDRDGADGERAVELLRGMLRSRYPESYRRFARTHGA